MRRWLVRKIKVQGLAGECLFFAKRGEGGKNTVQFDAALVQKAGARLPRYPNFCHPLTHPSKYLMLRY